MHTELGKGRGEEREIQTDFPNEYRKTLNKILSDQIQEHIKIIVLLE